MSSYSDINRPPPSKKDEIFKNNKITKIVKTSISKLKPFAPFSTAITQHYYQYSYDIKRSTFDRFLQMNGQRI